MDKQDEGSRFIPDSQESFNMSVVSTQFPSMHTGLGCAQSQFTYLSYSRFQVAFQIAFRISVQIYVMLFCNYPTSNEFTL